MPNHAVAGLVVFGIFAASTAAQLGLRGLPTDRALQAGCALLVAGVLTALVVLQRCAARPAPRTR